jgi:hypothetical protein
MMSRYLFASFSVRQSIRASLRILRATGFRALHVLIILSMLWPNVQGLAGATRPASAGEPIVASRERGGAHSHAPSEAHPVPADMSALGLPVATESPSNTTMQNAPAPTSTPTPAPSANALEVLAPPVKQPKSLISAGLPSFTAPQQAGTGSGANGETPIADGSANQSSPAATYNQNAREYLVVWVEDGTPTTVRGRILNSDGTPKSAPFTVATQNVGTPYGPQATYSVTSNRYLVVWSEPNGLVSNETYCTPNGSSCYTYTISRSNLYAQSVGADGILPAPAAMVTDQLTVWGSNEPAYSVAYNSQINEYLLVWEQPQGAMRFVCTTGSVNYYMARPHRVVGQKLDTLGQPQGSQSALLVGIVSSVRAVYSSVSNEYLVTGDIRDMDLITSCHPTLTRSNLYGRRTQANTLAQVGSLININGNAVGDQIAPDLAYDPFNNNYFAAWRDGRQSPTEPPAEIWGQIIEAGSGNLAGGNFAIIADANDAENLAVRYSPLEQRYLEQIANGLMA